LWLRISVERLLGSRDARALAPRGGCGHTNNASTARFSAAVFTSTKPLTRAAECAACREHRYVADGKASTAGEAVARLHASRLKDEEWRATVQVGD
jgi:hypothetical protein